MERLTFNPDLLRISLGQEPRPEGTIRYLGREYKVGDYINVLMSSGLSRLLQIAKIEHGAAYLREPKPERVIPKKGPVNQPWYQQHDKRKWK